MGTDTFSTKNAGMKEYSSTRNERKFDVQSKVTARPGSFDVTAGSLIDDQDINVSGTIGSETAKRRITDLTERVERLTSLLLKAEDEKRSLSSQLEMANEKLSLADHELEKLRLQATNVGTSDTTMPLQGNMPEPLAVGQTVTESLQRELYEYKQRDISFRDEIYKLKDQLSKSVMQSSDAVRLSADSREENSRLRISNESIQREVDRLRTEVQGLQNENYSLRDRLRSAEIAHAER